MYSLIALVRLEGEAARVSAALAGLGAAVAPVMEGSFNGGDLSAIWNFRDEVAYRTARPGIDAILNGAGVERADTAFFGHGSIGVREQGLSTGIHRTLLLCADRAASEAWAWLSESQRKRASGEAPAADPQGHQRGQNGSAGAAAKRRRPRDSVSSCLDCWSAAAPSRLAGGEPCPLALVCG